jgi:amino acid transporter
MGYWLVGALALGLASLAAARYISGPGWIAALVATGAFIGLALAMVGGMVLRRVARGSRWPWKAIAAPVLAVAAAVARASLVGQILRDPGASVTIDFWRLALACSTVVWGGVALVWGTLAVSEALDRPRDRDRVHWGHVVAAGCGVSLALYALAPLWYLLGLRINHITLLGLFGLACVAYLGGQLWRRLVKRSE